MEHKHLPETCCRSTHALWDRIITIRLGTTMRKKPVFIPFPVPPPGDFVRRKCHVVFRLYQRTNPRELVSVHINKTSTSHNESDKVNSSSSANSENMQFNSSGYSTSSNGNDANIDESYEAGSSSSASGYDNLKTGISQSMDFGSYTKDIESRHVLKSINPVVIGNNESQDDSNTSVDKKIDNPIENTGSMDYIGLLGLLMGLLLSILLLI